MKTLTGNYVSQRGGGRKGDCCYCRRGKEGEVCLGQRTKRIEEKFRLAFFFPHVECRVNVKGTYEKSREKRRLRDIPFIKGSQTINLTVIIRIAQDFLSENCRTGR